jgi:putative transposase
MAVRNKIFIPNEIYFLTFTILGWGNIFINDNYCDLVYKWFDYIKDNYGNKIHGYVIMPNHIHCLVYITDKSTKQSVLAQNAKRFLAYQIVDYLNKDDKMGILNYFKRHARKKFGAKHKVFEDGYDFLLIQSQKFFLEKLNYIHNNPCVERWNLAEYPEDYKHSSAANYILGQGVYNIDLVEF